MKLEILEVQIIMNYFIQTNSFINDKLHLELTLKSLLIREGFYDY